MKSGPLIEEAIGSNPMVYYVTMFSIALVVIIIVFSIFMYRVSSMKVHFSIQEINEIHPRTSL